MSKEWILNQAMNRWGLNKKRYVGAVSNLIRNCSPKTVDEWRNYYYKNVHPESYLRELGQKLYIKITEVIQHEIAEVTEEDCINYIKEVVIDRTFEGYQTEIHTIYGQLQSHINYHIEPAPDEWDRLFNVDFYIKIRDSYVGLQIKPISFEHTFEDYKWKEMQENTHTSFQKMYGGKVFTIFSIKEGDKKIIYNKEIIDDIKQEIKRLEEE
ncbi:MjaI family restriction endonuclease [Calorimonas adulescens]|uniref:MjaI family restriction endonuclease n=1 Tax=Calorimonas adulescens TaxID=2606906 RepID=A0A5D8QBH5_9THEO|nr:MjaI family restriction endonuclease [Calorimonas adulescens]TZE81146.1 MjaI family restriction endonuclease [Calorimonas adulescens]